MELSPAQKSVVDWDEGALLVLAGPGAGKTEVLCRRFENLARGGIDTEFLFLLTFTSAAAEEAVGRISRSLKIDRRQLKPQVCTYHALGRRILCHEMPFPLQEEPKIKEGRQKRLIENLLRPGLSYTDASSYISLQKRNLHSPEEALAAASGYRDRALAEIYAAYESALRNDRVIDYDSMIYEAVRLLLAKPELAERYQRRIKHLMVDEFQDTNLAQQKFSSLISKGCTSFVAVGDYFQAIYGFAGANCEVIRSFDEEFPQRAVFHLVNNYRSTKRIIDLYRRSVSPLNEFKEFLQQAETPNPMGEQPVFQVCRSPQDECRFVFDEIGKLSSGGRRSLGDFALLFRTNRQMRAAEDECATRGWAYQSPGCGFYGRREIRLVAAMLGMLEDPNSYESIRCRCNSGKCGKCKNGVQKMWIGHRILRSGLDCARYLNPRVVFSVIENSPNGPYEAFGCYKDKNPAVQRSVRNFFYLFEGLKESCGSLPMPRQLELIYERTGLIDWLRRNEELGEGDNSRAANAQELLDASARFAGRQEFLTFLTSTASVPRKNDHRGRRGNWITLSTVHQAKGREWPFVFVCGLTDGLFPHKDGDPAEERRLLYVAISRAKDLVFLSSSGRPSEFLTDGSMITKPNEAEMPRQEVRLSKVRELKGGQDQ